MTQTTLKDIAKKLGLSTSTVSRSLSDHHAISLETKQKVKELADKMDYKVNPMALGLKNRRTFTIGIIVPDLAHHYFAAIISGAQEELYKEGYNLLICQSNENPEIEAKLIHHLISHQVDGILISICKSSRNSEIYHKIIQNKTPLVFFDRICDELQHKSSSVTLNDYLGAFNATKMLLESGSKNPAIITVNKNLNIGRDREKGFLECLAFNDIKFNPIYRFETDFTLEQSKQLTYELLALKNRPDGIFVSTGLATLGCISALKEKGFNLGEEIKIAGFLNDLYSGYKEQGLIRAIPPVMQMGTEAAKMVLNIINGKAIKTEMKLDTPIIVS